jgi:hypothetical protein
MKTTRLQNGHSKVRIEGRGGRESLMLLEILFG